MFFITLLIEPSDLATANNASRMRKLIGISNSTPHTPVGGTESESGAENQGTNRTSHSGKLPTPISLLLSTSRLSL